MRKGPSSARDRQPVSSPQERHHSQMYQKGSLGPAAKRGDWDCCLLAKTQSMPGWCWCVWCFTRNSNFCLKQPQMLIPSLLFSIPQGNQPKEWHPEDLYRLWAELSFIKALKSWPAHDLRHSEDKIVSLWVILLSRQRWKMTVSLEKVFLMLWSYFLSPRVGS